MQAIRQGGALGIVQDLFMLFGGENVIRAVTGGKTKYQSQTRISNDLQCFVDDFLKVSSVVTSSDTSIKIFL